MVEAAGQHEIDRRASLSVETVDPAACERTVEKSANASAIPFNIVPAGGMTSAASTPLQCGHSRTERKGQLCRPIDEPLQQ
jgi:hypothetical protein